MTPGLVQPLKRAPFVQLTAKHTITRKDGDTVLAECRPFAGEPLGTRCPRELASRRPSAVRRGPEDTAPFRVAPVRSGKGFGMD